MAYFPSIKLDQTAASTAAWTSATSSNTTLSLSVLNESVAAISFNETDSGTAVLSGGVITFEASDDSGTTWYPINAVRIGAFTSDTTYTLTGGKQLWQLDVHGLTNCRVRLSTVITQGAGTGTATANIRIQAQAGPAEPAVVVGQSSASQLAMNVGQINGVAPLMGNGVTGTGSPRVTLASDTTANSNPFLIRHAAATTSSGLLIAKVLAAANTTPVSVKTSAAQIYGWHLVNNATSTRYFRVFNVSSSPTMGTTSPTFVLPLPGSGGAVMVPNVLGIPMGTGIFYSITTGAADLDNTAPAANDCVGTLFYI